MIEDQKQSEMNLDNQEQNSELSEELESDNNTNQEGSLSIDSDSDSISKEEAATSAETSSSVLANGEEEANTMDASQYELAIETLQQEIASLGQQLEQQTQQVETFKSQYIRIAADFDNFRKRTLREKEELEYQVKRNTITDLLSAIDSFERARTQIKPNNDGEMEIHKSYQGVYKQLVDGLKRIGVSPMRSDGQEFDPNFHEAIYREPTDEYPEGIVMEQVVRGYLLGDRVLRHAMVKVAAPIETVVTSEEETSIEESNSENTEN